LVCGNFKWSEMPQDRTRGFLLGWWWNFKSIISGGNSQIMNIANSILNKFIILLWGVQLYSGYFLLLYSKKEINYSDGWPSITETGHIIVHLAEASIQVENLFQISCHSFRVTIPHSSTLKDLTNTSPSLTPISVKQHHFIL
jgi:hypothetical protein